MTTTETRLLGGIAALCPDCGDERTMMLVEAEREEYCCTDCDAAVLLSAAS